MDVRLPSERVQDCRRLDRFRGSFVLEDHAARVAGSLKANDLRFCEDLHPPFAKGVFHHFREVGVDALSSWALRWMIVTRDPSASR
jgi:hypothetical protein